MCVSRLQCEVKLQRQQLSDSQHLLQSLRLELQVYEKIKTEAQKHDGTASCLLLCSLHRNRVRQDCVIKEQQQIIYILQCFRSNFSSLFQSL